MGARHRKPSFADSLAPREERKPLASAGSDRDRQPVWLLERIDFDGPWVLEAHGRGNAAPGA
ncbi:MAG TPA: hypothetical protein VFJ16_25390 [Longimicrobium sp.]|nr:hypothetical protein [Longimicrobium sp.]